MGGESSTLNSLSGLWVCSNLLLWTRGSRITILQVDPTANCSNLVEDLIFIAVGLSHVFMFFFMDCADGVFMAACFAFPLPSCSCTTSMFVLHVCSTKATVTLSPCAILSTLPLTYAFPFPPVGHRVQEEVGFSGYRAWGGGQRRQYRLWSCSLGYTLSCEFLLIAVMSKGRRQCVYIGHFPFLFLCKQSMIDLGLSFGQQQLLTKLQLHFLF